MDSSPDLSLKLRRGSSDSRDTFYMDFAQGIDSDIEEVDNSAIAREPQQPPTPPLPIPQDILDAEIAAMAQMIPPPPQTTSAMTMQPTHLPTLSEHDDLPPTPPPQLSSTAMSSPPASPTNSVLEMIPPPPMSPPIAAPMRFASSPPIETEDEGDDGDADEPDDADEEDNDDDDEYKSTPPPPLPPLPSNLSYIHGSGGPHVSPIASTAPLSPSITKSPSTSPSPPITPPVLTKFTSPPVAYVPPTHVPTTSPSESDQSQPNSPPPLPPHHDTPPQPISPKSISAELSAPSPPPLYDETNEMIAAVLAAAVEATADFVPPAPYQMPDENKSLNDDESTTITTPPSNGYSGSSILAPTSEHLGELEKDAGLVLADIPPPPGLEDEPKMDEEASGEKTPISEQQPDDVVTEDQITRDIPIDEEAEEPGTPTQQTTSIASGSLKRSGSIGGATSHAASRSVSRSGSRSGSRKSSRSGSVRGSIGSRAGSIAAGSVASAAASIASGVQQGVVTSPQASIKSLRSQQSIKSQHSKHSIPPNVRSPPLSARMQSPPEGDGAPIMPTPPMMRSPPPVKSPPVMHSPPIVTSPPRVYSPPLVSSPPMRKSIIETTETDKAGMPEKR
ncbi:proton channel OtopLc-like [Teleopsis dalmanni]|uniref:proton channel OtopLc-like n=1 Tax=Teleopsis dalmanni TaxID=139649 RepID=UPI0018CCE54F|nr:proton channel OtopLc-like [Teleopsis dalmanni]